MSRATIENVLFCLHNKTKMNEFIRNLWNLNLSEYFENRDFEINKFLLILSVGICAACLVSSLWNTKISLLVKKLLRANAFSEKEAKTLGELHLDGDRLLVKMLASKGGKLAHFVKKTNEQVMTYDEYMALEKQKAAEKKEKRQEKLARLRDRLLPNAGKTNACDPKGNGLSMEEGREERTAPNDPAGEGPDVSEAPRYYIPDAVHDRAKHFFENDRSSLPNAVLFCLLILAVAVILALMMPSILSLLRTVLEG